MIQLFKSNERGRTELDWLDSRHTFSFGDHYDPSRMGAGPLRVLNEDVIAPGMGFGAHPHQEMEIITYILSGSLEHKDSLGHDLRIARGEVQAMSAGTGIVHSEKNPDSAKPVHLLQIWIEPAENQRGGNPSHRQLFFPDDKKRGKLLLCVSPDGRAGSLPMRQNALMFAGLFEGRDSAAHALFPGRSAFIHCAKGSIEVCGQTLQAGDALFASNTPAVPLRKGQGSEILLFDLPS